MKNQAILLTLFAVAISATTVRADQVTVLETAYTYAVLGSTSVNSTGPTVVNGDLGVAPGTAMNGFPPATVTGAFHDNDSAVLAAQSDASAGFTTLSALTPTQALAIDLGGLKLTSGVYSFSSSASLTGTLTLDFQGMSNANIVFQVDGSLITADNSAVNIINLGANDNVYYVTNSATLGANSTLTGDVIANSNIVANTGASITCGSLISLHGGITLDSNPIHNCSATGSDVSNTVFTPPGTVPEPGTFALLATGLFGAAGIFRRKFSPERNKEPIRPPSSSPVR